MKLSKRGRLLCNIIKLLLDRGRLLCNIIELVLVHYLSYGFRSGKPENVSKYSPTIG